MYILAIETTGATASVALIDGKGAVSFEESGEKLNHLQNLITMTEALLGKNKITIGDISAIAVSEGPGSFTGIRIGVSTARALAQALNLQIIAVPTLKTFAYNVPSYEGIICPIFDARREQVYGGAYLWNETGLEAIEKVKGNAYSIQELFQELEKVCSGYEVQFFGDGIQAYETHISQWAEKNKHRGITVALSEENIRFQKASSVARLGLELYRQNKMTNYENMEPVYMRKAEAERKLEEGRLNNV